MALISTLAATHLNPGICNALVQFIWTEYHQTVTCVVQLPTNIDESSDDGFGRRSSRKPIGQSFLCELSYRMSRRKPFRKWRGIVKNVPCSQMEPRSQGLVTQPWERGEKCWRVQSRLCKTGCLRNDDGNGNTKLHFNVTFWLQQPS